MALKKEIEQLLKGAFTTKQMDLCHREVTTSLLSALSKVGYEDAFLLFQDQLKRKVNAEDFLKELSFPHSRKLFPQKIEDLIDAKKLTCFQISLCYRPVVEDKLYNLFAGCHIKDKKEYNGYSAVQFLEEVADNFDPTDTEYGKRSYSYAEVVKEHLSKYEGCGITNEMKGGTYQGKPYTHILKDDIDKFNNVFEEYRDDIRSMNIKFHTDFNHLNSSQAFCLNLLYPLVYHNCLNLLLRMVNPTENWGEIIYSAFEKYSEYETWKEKDRTQFDFYIKTSTGCQISFEIKYTENEFGIAERDKSGRWHDRYRHIYAEYQKLMPKCIIANRQYDAFLNHYQIIRNLINLQDNTKHYAVFLFPAANTDILKQSKEINSYVTEDFRGKISIIYVEDLIELLCENKDVEILKDYYRSKFSRKYFPSEEDLKLVKAKKVAIVSGCSGSMKRRVDLIPELDVFLKKKVIIYYLAAT